MDYYDMGTIIDVAAATGHTLRVEVDNGELVGTGESLSEDWDMLAPGESFTIHAWTAFDGTEHPADNAWSVVQRMLADFLRDAAGDPERIARAGDAFAMSAEPDED